MSNRLWARIKRLLRSEALELDGAPHMPLTLEVKHLRNHITWLYARVYALEKGKCD